MLDKLKRLWYNIITKIKERRNATMYYEVTIFYSKTNQRKVEIKSKRTLQKWLYDYYTNTDERRYTLNDYWSYAQVTPLAKNFRRYVKQLIADEYASETRVLRIHNGYLIVKVQDKKFK